LGSLLRGRPVSIPDLHIILQGNLALIAHPTAEGGHNAEITDRQGRTYRLAQQGPDAPIELTVTAKGATPNAQVKLASIVYLSDGRISSEAGNAAHSPHTQPNDIERRYTGSLHALIQTHVENLNAGWKKFHRIKDALQQLKGSYHPADRSLWHRHHVVHDGRVYSLQTRNTGPLDLFDLNEIELVLHEEAPQERKRILSLSPTGEVDRQISQGTKRIGHPNQMALLDTIATHLENAAGDPGYLWQVAQKIEKLKKPFPIPDIEHAFNTPKHEGQSKGPQGEPILPIRDGKTLWNHIRPGAPGHVWEDPAKKRPAEVLRTPWALRRPMYLELIRWAWSTFRYGSFEDIQNYKPSSGSIQLHLEPGGGGQVSIFRGAGDGRLHDVIRVTGDGNTLRVGAEIRRLKRSTPGFKALPREEQVRRASQLMSENPSIPWDLQLQEVPPLTLDELQRLHREGSIEIRDAHTAWQQIRALPQLQGIRMEASSLSTEGDLVTEGSKHTDRIVVEFPGSKVPIQLIIRQSTVLTGPASDVPRVDIFYNYGIDSYQAAVAYEDGKPALEVKQVFGQTRSETMEGQVSRKQAALWANSFSRFRARLFWNGAHYTFGHFATIPMAQGLEYLWLTDGERELAGTHSPGLDYKGLAHGVMMFGAMWGSSSVAAYWTDAVYNYVVGLNQMRRYKVPTSTWRNAYRLSPPVMNNVGARTRPLGGPIRGALQWFIPLYAGLASIEFAERGIQLDWKHLLNTHIDTSKIDSARFWQSLWQVGAVSLATTGAWQLVQGSARGWRWAQQAKLLTTKVNEIGNPRFSLTTRASFATILLEFAALRIWDTVERVQQLRAGEATFRRDLAYAINLQNEHLSRMEHGEKVSLQTLASANHTVKEAESRYRDFLKIIEHETGTGEFTSIKPDNDFQDTYEFFGTRQGMDYGTDPECQTRLMELRARESRLQARLQALYREYGVTPQQLQENPKAKDEETLMKMAEAEQKIYREETAVNFHVTRHTQELAKNTHDLNIQMENYHRETDRRLNRALPRILVNQPREIDSEKSPLESRTVGSPLFGFSWS
jgi:hypothetical protein